jgi:DNA (cytosine-5)-methyltransferase 1
VTKARYRKPATRPVRPSVLADKPVYRVPTMAEIVALPWNGYQAVSTFSGCGGSSTGYRMAGFRMAYVNEFVEAARDTYRANAAPYTHVDGRDIREVTGSDLLAAAGLGVGEIDVFDGSPPCASFSTAGKRDEGWGLTRKYSDTAQRSDDLFFEYARLIRDTQPRTFVAENVSGLVKGSAKGYFLLILAELKAAGYRVGAQLLDASWLGVPQARQRLIFVGVREDLEQDPRFPKPLPYQYAVRDALPWILRQARGRASFGPDSGSMEPADAPSGTFGAGVGSGNGYWPPSMVESTKVVHDTSGQFSSGDCTDRPIPTILTGPNALNSRHYQVHERRLVHDRGPSWHAAGDVTDRPVPTITTGVDALNSRHYQVHEGQPFIIKDGYSPAVGPVDLDAPSPTVMAHGIGGVYRDQAALFAAAPVYDDEGVPLDPETRQPIGLDHRFIVTRNSGDGPDVTRRRLTLGELRALSGFPPDFQLTGSYAQRWERIGRAVPPVMMSHIAATVRDEILAPAREAGRI